MRCSHSPVPFCLKIDLFGVILYYAKQESRVYPSFVKTKNFFGIR